jgi:prepilin-type N-terminal cleavage/methylation domain-containing protein
VVIHRRTGFTLVEVIVVLVILAILAAIAIPALTGYIDKAEDKKWIAQARNSFVSVRTVLEEAYVDGTLCSGYESINPDYLTNGNTTDGNYTYFKVKYFNIWHVSDRDNYISSNGAISSIDKPMYFRKAAKLMSAFYPALPTSPGTWSFIFFSPKTSSYNILNAPAYIFEYYPNGINKNAPVILVTYGISAINVNNPTQSNVINYPLFGYGSTVLDPNAGYNVYYTTTTYQA